MDKKLLQRLRERYADAPGDRFFSERFQRAGEQLAKASHKLLQPYNGVATLLDQPFQCDLDDLDLALVGIPMDLGVTNRAGARLGPRAVRSVERIGPYHPTHDIVPRAILRAADVGDVPMKSRFDLHQCLRDIEEFFVSLRERNIVPLSVGGDHSITYPIMKALGAETPLGMVHIDAHCDTGGAYDGEKFHHGGPFRQAVLAGVLDPKRCIQIGIRGTAGISTEFSYDSGMTVVHIEDVYRDGIEAVAERARAVVAGGPLYVSVDVDGIDPAYTPGTGTPEIGGLTPLEVQLLLRSLRGLPIIGGDVVEIAPQYDSSSNTAHVGAAMLFELFALAALAGSDDTV
ncbi:MAG: guanidinopropionase [Gammaproteobacteria bacterium]|jgi:guanidinopropionase